jgi:hypothetical protein
MQSARPQWRVTQIWQIMLPGHWKAGSSSALLAEMSGFSACSLSLLLFKKAVGCEALSLRMVNTGHCLGRL